MKTKGIFIGGLVAALTNLGGYSMAQVADPVLTTSGVQSGIQTVSITVTDATSGAVIRYTTDQTNPTATSGNTVNSGSTILVAQNATVKAQAFSGTTASNLVVSQYASTAIVSAGDEHTLWLKSDGTLFASGDNSAGELGTGNTTPNNQPTQVMGNGPNGLVPFGNCIAIAAGTNQSFAVDSLGEVWAWGDNTGESLGTQTSGNCVSPTQVIGLNNIVAIASAGGHTLALRGDGTVWAWGANGSGQIGNGSSGSTISTPSEVVAPTGQPGYLTNIVAITAGANHSMALDKSGNVWAWGANGSGQLGNSVTDGVAKVAPVQVSTVASVVEIIAATSNSYALENNGTVWAWGDNSVGQLGNGTTTPVSTIHATPTQISSLPPIVALANHSALDTSNKVWIWGDNSTGQIGIGIVGSYASVPVAANLSSAPSPTLTISAGNNQAVSLGNYSTPLTVTVTSSGSPVQNAIVNFTVTAGGGLLTANTSSPIFSGIIQAQTNSAGQTSVFYLEPSTGSANAQIVATTGGVQATFTIAGSVPSTPTGFTGGPGISAGQIALAWTATSGANSYLLQRSTSAGGSYSSIATISSPATTYIDSDASLLAGQTYYYELAASNNVGTSLYTAPISASPYVPPGIIGWRYTYFGATGLNPTIANGAADTANPTHDGFSNLLKYGLGMNPTVNYYTSGSTAAPVVQIENISGTPYLTLTFTGVASDVTYNVQASGDLISWSNVRTFSGPGAPGTVTVQDSQPVSASTKRFMRLQVVDP